MRGGRLKQVLLISPIRTRCNPIECSQGKAKRLVETIQGFKLETPSMRNDL